MLPDQKSNRVLSDGIWAIHYLSTIDNCVFEKLNLVSVKSLACIGSYFILISSHEN
jgi:hypothetical protein